MKYNKRDISIAQSLIQHGCARCCRQVTMNIRHELDCSAKHLKNIPAPIRTCPLIRIYKSVTNELTDPKKITEGYVEKVRLHWNDGKWDVGESDVSD